MMTAGIHILGASGSGTSTLGRAVARQLSAQFFDTDDFFWFPTDPPFQTKRPAPERLARLREALSAANEWVLTGSLCGWGDGLIPHFQLVVFLDTVASVRLDRLRDREIARFGVERLKSGGDLHERHVEFLQWAAAYDTGSMEMRSRSRHEAWLAELPATTRVLRLDGSLSIDDLAAAIIRAAAP